MQRGLVPSAQEAPGADLSQPIVSLSTAHLDRPYGLASPEQNDLNIFLKKKGGQLMYKEGLAGWLLIQQLRHYYVTHITALQFEKFEESELKKILEPLQQFAKNANFVFNTRYVANAYGLSEKDQELKKQGDDEAKGLVEEIEERKGNTLVVRIGGRNKPFDFLQRFDFLKPFTCSKF